MRDQDEHLYTASEDGSVRCWALGAAGSETAALHSARSTWPNVVDGCLKGLCVISQLTAYVFTLPLAWPQVCVQAVAVRPAPAAC